MRFYILDVWVHPIEGGDDYPELRGFRTPDHVEPEELSTWFARHVNTKSAVPDDFTIRETTKEEWEEYFTVKEETS